MLHITPLLDASLFTVAVIIAMPPGFTMVVLAERETEIGGGGGCVEPPPLQPAMLVTRTRPASEQVRANVIFTGPPQRLGIGTPGQLLDVN